jgi:hypothetical protein
LSKVSRRVSLLLLQSTLRKSEVVEVVRESKTDLVEIGFEREREEREKEQRMIEGEGHSEEGEEKDGGEEGRKRN